MTEKKSSNGFKEWALRYVLTGALIVLFGVGAWWFANASDTLKNIVTQKDVALLLKAETVSRAGVEEIILTETEPDRRDLKNLAKDFGEFKDDFKEYKDEQKELQDKMAERQAADMELIRREQGEAMRKILNEIKK